ncbi:hypothetical protein N9L47_06570 [Rhodobacteraceae bacterium]|nr:hypothetical protein [Paracoccaceae bacterium]
MRIGLNLLFITCFAGLLLTGASVQSEAIRRACLQSDRSGSGPTVCRCIQGVADQTLSTRDQRRAAKFFSDPDEAQSVRQSTRRGDEAFWERYKQFGVFAERSCRS